MLWFRSVTIISACTFEVAPFEYEVHTLFVPDGYEADTSLILHTKASDDEITFKINKK